jgi:hypothetical protein
MASRDRFTMSTTIFPLVLLDVLLVLIVRAVIRSFPLKEKESNLFLCLSSRHGQIEI